MVQEIIHIMNCGSYKIRFSIPFLPRFESYIKRLEELWETGYLVGGKYSQLLQFSLKDLLGVRHVILVPSGSLALTLLLKALIVIGRLEKGRRVAVPDFTFIATLNAVHWANLQPVLLDVDPDTFLIDYRLIEALKDEVDLILGVDVFGNSLDYDLIKVRLGSDVYHRKPLLVSDSAEAFSARYKGKPLGSQALAHVFSFSPSKLVTGVQLGVITTDDDELAEAISSLKVHGHPELGFNARVSELHALLLYLSLSEIQGIIEKRRELVELYRKHLEIQGFQFQQVTPNSDHVWTYVTVKLPDDCKLSPDQILKLMARRGIELKRYFKPLSMLTGKRIDYSFNPLKPISHYLYLRTVSLPVGPHLKPSDVEHISEELVKLINS